MVDFDKLGKQRGTSSKPVDPFVLFRRLPRSKINDLWNSQAEALRNWNLQRNNKDNIIKLNTGGGKTLVGLIIAKSIMNQTNGSALYLTPTNQLAKQTQSLSEEYNIETTLYKSGQDFNDDFLTGKSIMIATYSALFNARSKFGCTESSGEYINLECLILDDAHTTFSNMRRSFTLSIERSKYENLYLELCNIFRDDINQIDRIATFDEILANKDTMILEIPYWGWKQKLTEIRSRISRVSSEFPFIWPLLRDEFEYCHAFIGPRSFSITPLYPLTDKFPSFYRCPRRIYMSATLADDSSIVRTFNADVKSVSEPIIPESFTGIGERMILAPALMEININNIYEFIKLISKEVSESAGVLIIAPSNKALEKWSDVSYISSGSEDVDRIIQGLRSGELKGIFAIANRYDGLDLKDDSCRLLILDGKPIGENIYDSFMRRILGNSRFISTSTAQRIEQGIGRGTRGSGDYCVIIMLGDDLVSWISKSNNLAQLTPSSQAQMMMGNDISRNVKSFEELKDTIYKCIHRDDGWIRYHAEGLADLTSTPQQDLMSLKMAGDERKHFELIRAKNYDDSISVLKKYLDGKPVLDDEQKGWMYQLCARAAYFWENEELSNKFQKRAYSLNKKLLKPRAELAYLPSSRPGNQSAMIILPIKEFKERRGYISEFKRIVSLLNPSATTNQFEQSLAELGSLLGFHSERPDNSMSIGPDVLWIVDEKKGFVIEVKSNKEEDSTFNKGDDSQMITSFDWFVQNYPEYRGIKIAVQPTNYASSSIAIKDLFALTFDNLDALISNIGTLIYELTNSSVSDENLVVMCERRISELHLTPEGIVNNFLKPFEIKK